MTAKSMVARQSKSPRYKLSIGRCSCKFDITYNKQDQGMRFNFADNIGKDRLTELKEAGYTKLSFSIYYLAEGDTYKLCIQTLNFAKMQAFQPL